MTMNFAIIKTGGKQYMVSPGDTIKIEKMKGEYKEGDKLTFDNVLMTIDGDKMNMGSPTIEDGAVKATLVTIGRDKKIDVIKYKQKSRYFKKNGHRQPHFKVKIDTI